MIKDSGSRTEFESGAVRDIQKGKGRCDLLPLNTLKHLYFYRNDYAANVFGCLDDFVNSGRATTGAYEHLKKNFLISGRGSTLYTNICSVFY